MRIIGIGLIAIMLALSPAAALETEDVYLIGRFEDLEALSRLVAEGEGAYTGEVRLISDIEAERPFMPIGDEAHMFSGTFDGQGHVISGLCVNAHGDFSGLFGCVGAEGVICNLTLENVLVSGERYTGAVAGFSSGRIENCTVSGGRVIGKSKNEYSVATGGIVGLNCGSAAGCANLGADVYGGRYVGGIAGSLCSGKMERCLGAGNVYSWFEGEALVGGVAGAVQSGGEVDECIGAANVYARRSFDVGGVAGGILSGSLSKCAFLGAAEGKEAGAIAGFSARRAQVMACLYDSRGLTGVGEGKQDGTMPVPVRGFMKWRADWLLPVTAGDR